MRLPSEDPEKTMSVIEHLEELRMRLIMSLVFLFLGICVGLYTAKPVLEILVRPFNNIHIVKQGEPIRLLIQADGTLKYSGPLTKALLAKVPRNEVEFFLPGHAPGKDKPDLSWSDAQRKPVFFHPLDPISIYFHVALFTGFIVAFPFIMYQIWLFVAPGLKARERKTLVPLLLLAACLFPAGASFAYFMFGQILDFLMNFQIISLDPQLEIWRLVKFETQILMTIGIIFELPVIVMFLTLIGVLSPTTMRKYRPYAMVGIALFSMGITPGTDPISMLIVMLPLIILYEISIWLSVPLAKRRDEERLIEQV